VEGRALQLGRTSLRYEVWDAFTDKPFGGNPRGVFFGADGLSEQQMFALTRERNHSETTFVSRAGKVRIFTATQEPPFTGRPALGTAFAFRRQRPGAKQIVAPAPQGPIPVDSVDERDASRPIENVSTGRSNLIMMLKTMAAVKRANGDVEEVRAGARSALVLEGRVNRLA
jgi:trans-2,3-dihydro-3-hydroxyanthranilate isomerase